MIVNDFITELKQTDYWRMLFNKHDVVMIHLIGSYLTCLTDDKSDIDLLLLCADMPPNSRDNLLKFKYKDKSVHICYHSLHSYIYHTANLHLSKLCGVQCQFLHDRPESIVYIRDGHEMGLDYLLSIKSEVSNVSSNILLYCAKHIVEGALENGLSSEYRTKWLHHMVMCYNIVSGTEIDRHFLTRLKRIRTDGITSEDERLLWTLLKEIWQYINTLDIVSLQNSACKLNLSIQQKFELRR